MRLELAPALEDRWAPSCDGVLPLELVVLADEKVVMLHAVVWFLPEACVLGEFVLELDASGEELGRLEARLGDASVPWGELSPQAIEKRFLRLGAPARWRVEMAWADEPAASA